MALSRYRKTFAAFTAAVVTSIACLWDGVQDAAEATLLASTWLGVVGVYLFPNDAPEGEPADPAISERGRVDAAIVTAVASVAMLALLVCWAWDLGPFA